MSSLLPFPTIHFLYKCYVRPLLEYAIPIWMFSLSNPLSNTLDRLRATAARAYLASKLKCQPDWMTPKEELNRLSSWESLAWRRQILSLVYFHHLFRQCPYILSHFHFHPSQMPRRPCSIVLPQSGSSFSKSPLFLLSIAWNKLPENIRAITAPSAFNSEIRKLLSAHMFSLKEVPLISVLDFLLAPARIMYL